MNVGGVCASISMSVEENCPVQVRVRDSNRTCFVFGNAEELDITFEGVAPLQTFAGLAQQAVAEMLLWEANAASGDALRPTAVLRPGGAL